MTGTSPRALESRTSFRVSCEITCNIDATPARIWSLLTNAEDLPRWNSTVTSLEGTIRQGERLVLRVRSAPARTFTPRVTKLEPETSMEWSDGVAPLFRGVRRFTLSPNPDGSTVFSMIEVLSGLMLPLIKGSLPDFGPAFEAYAANLKSEAERRT